MHDMSDRVGRCACSVRGVPIALSTSNSKSVAEAKMKHHPKLFSDFTPSKPQRLFSLKEGEDGDKPTALSLRTQSMAMLLLTRQICTASLSLMFVFTRKKSKELD